MMDNAEEIPQLVDPEKKQCVDGEPQQHAPTTISVASCCKYIVTSQSCTLQMDQQYCCITMANQEKKTKTYAAYLVHKPAASSDCATKTCGCRQ